MALDDTGIYVVSTVNGALPGMSSAGGSDIFVRKYDADGEMLWTRWFGSSAAD